MGLQQFEERLERLVEGTLAKPFRSNLQPVEIGRRLTREMDLHRRVGVRGLIAPNVFTVTLAPADVDRFANFIDALVPGAGRRRPGARQDRGLHLRRPGGGPHLRGHPAAGGPIQRDHRGPGGPRRAGLAELFLPDGGRVPLGGDPVVIGRLPECAVVLPDPNVSRRHAEIRRVGDAVVVTDLGSTNGTRVNGIPVREQHLASGDEITVGSTTLVFEQAVIRGRACLFCRRRPNYSAILRPLQWLVIALIFLFFLRVVRAVFVEIRPAGVRTTRAERRRLKREQAGSGAQAAPAPALLGGGGTRRVPAVGRSISTTS